MGPANKAIKKKSALSDGIKNARSKPDLLGMEKTQSPCGYMEISHANTHVDRRWGISNRSQLSNQSHRKGLHQNIPKRSQCWYSALVGWIYSIVIDRVAGLRRSAVMNRECSPKTDQQLFGLPQEAMLYMLPVVSSESPGGKTTEGVFESRMPKA
jgi:hypothetical protein